MFVDILLYMILFGIVETVLYYVCLKKVSKPNWRHFLPQLLLLVMLIVTIMRVIPFFDMAHARSIRPNENTGIFVVLAVSVMIVWVLGVYWLRQRLTVVEKRMRWPLWSRILSFVLLSISAALVSFATWFRSFFGQLTPEQFLFNLQSPVVGTADSMSMEIIFSPVFAMLIIMIILGYIIFWSKAIVCFKLKKQITHKLGTILSVVILALSITYDVVLLRLDSIVRAYVNQSTYIEDNYVDIRKTNPVFPEKKRNLIHIYMESVENSYFDKSLGGHMDKNLMPELSQLTREGVHFSHTDKMGGPHQTYGSSWSVAAMVNMMSGVPLKVAMDQNAYGKSGYFLPGIYNLGNLLHDNGYEQTVMFGADADFGGLTTYFNSHGNFNIFDVKYARKQQLIPQDYNVWWGFEDEKLYTFAKQEITRLANTGKPFHFAMENADTHFPNGYITDKTPRIYESQYANVIAYSQKQVVELVRWIQKQPFYANTTIVITGDHLSMDKDFFEQFDPNYERTVYNVILNAPIKPEKTTNRHYSPVDFYPTILASIGVTFDGNRAGLGTNLFSNVPTLIERDGLEKFNSELEQNSNFYNREFVSERGHEKNK